jgi:hypothetical protein
VILLFAGSVGHDISCRKCDTLGTHSINQFNHKVPGKKINKGQPHTNQTVSQVAFIVRFDSGAAA